MTPASSRIESTLLAPRPVLRWRSWPLVDEGWQQLAFVVGLVLIAGVGAYLATDRWYLGLLAAAVMAGGLWRFLIPITYECNDEGVQIEALGFGRLVPWRAIRAVEIHRRGLLLLPAVRNGPLALLRGVYVPFGPFHDEMLAVIEFYARPPNSNSNSGSKHGSTATAHF